VLRVGDKAIFESAVILEYLEETLPHPLHPGNPLERAEHRSWIEFGSAVLQDIAGMYSVSDANGVNEKTAALGAKFALVEKHLSDGPYFAGAKFGLVDTVFGPVFRYFDVFDQIDDFAIFDQKPKVAAWRRALKARSSVREAVVSDYEQRLWKFIEQKGSYLGKLAKKHRAEARNVA
jgi:glutathione S-transferase